MDDGRPGQADDARGRDAVGNGSGLGPADEEGWPVLDPWGAQKEALGAFIRSQRQLAQLSLRQLAELTSLSNPYLSQVERGMHQPSVRVLKLIAEALNISAESLLTQAGLLDGQDPGAASPAPEQVAAAIRTDDRLTSEEKAALIAVYDSMVNTGRGIRDL
jgi:transcriptional regulator with XRE-family HTH domain